MKTVSMMLILILVLLGGDIAKVVGLHCAHCGFTKITFPGEPASPTVNHSRLRPDSINVGMDHLSCAPGRNPDPYVSVDCAKLYQPMFELSENMSSDLPVNQLEFNEYLRPTSATNLTKTEFSCFALFSNETQIIDGKVAHVELTFRSCMETVIPFSDLINEIHGEAEGDNMTGYTCYTDNCNRFDDEVQIAITVANSSAVTTVIQENIFSNHSSSAARVYFNFMNLSIIAIAIFISSFI